LRASSGLVVLNFSSIILLSVIVCSHGLSISYDKILVNIFSAPRSMALDPVTRKLFVTNVGGQVLRYASIDTLTTTSVPEMSINPGGGGRRLCTASSFYSPYQLWFNSNNQVLYVSDVDAVPATRYGRILGFKNAATANITVADFVIGQTDLTHCNSSMFVEAVGMCIDQKDILWVLTLQSQVLGYRSASTLQGPVTPFTSYQLPIPIGGDSKLWKDDVTDTLYGVSTSYAWFLFQQASTGLSIANFHSFGINTIFPSDSTFATTTGLVQDDGGNLYISDANWNRVLVYEDARNINVNGIPKAAQVLGQPNFTDAAKTFFNIPKGIVWDNGKKQLLIADYGSSNIYTFSVTGEIIPTTGQSSSGNVGLRSFSWLMALLATAFAS